MSVFGIAIFFYKRNDSWNLTDVLWVNIEDGKPGGTRQRLTLKDTPSYIVLLWLLTLLYASLEL